MRKKAVYIVGLCLPILLFPHSYPHANDIDFLLNKVYEGDNLKEIAFPLGGFGAGQVYIKGNGKLSPWEIMNNFNSNANVSDAFFALFLARSSDITDTKLLQIDPVLPAPGINKIQFIGEFPFAKLSFLDYHPELEISMECFSPFIPLDTQNSSLPLIFFKFILENKTDKPLTGTLLGSVPNLIGWDGNSELVSTTSETQNLKLHQLKYSEFEGNKNTVLYMPDSLMLFMENEYSGEDKFDKKLRLFTNQFDSAYPLRFTKNLEIFYGDEIETDVMPDSNYKDIYWLGPSEKLISDAKIEKLNDKLKSGAYIIINGGTNSISHLVYALESSNKRRKPWVFDNFENGNYKNWKVSGDAFGEKPADGKFQNQTDISGQEGRFFINTFNGDDRKTGKAISKDFLIKHSFLTFRIGGGNKPNSIYIALYVEGNKVKSATGDNSEALKKVIWNISEYKGKNGHLEIVDNDQEGWGHILIDEIIFTDEIPIKKESINIIKSWLPFKKMEGEIKDGEVIINAKDISDNLSSFSVRANKFFEFSDVSYSKEANIILRDGDKSPLLITKKIGKGRILWCNGDITKWGEGLTRRDIISTVISVISNNKYTPPTGYSPSHILWGNTCMGILKSQDKVEITSQWRNFYSFWEKFSKDGCLPEPESTLPAERYYTWNSAIGYKFKLNPKERDSVVFFLSWYFPNRTRHNQYLWKLKPLRYDYRLGNFYNNLFRSALEVAKYGIEKYDYLYSMTQKFHRNFYSSSLPKVVLEAIGANIATIHSPVYIFLENGTVGGFEGTDACCPLNCTHVYNYAQALPFLFPQLEQRIRFQELFFQMEKSEYYIPHRLIVPIEEAQFKNEIGGPFHHALDGELGTLLKLYREYRIANNKRLIEPLIPYAVKVLKHILRYHDPEGEGFIRGEQPNTYDTHLYGSNTFIGTLYLATLKAMETLLKEFNYPDKILIEECSKRFNSGRDKYIEKCWNGEYFINLYDAPDVGQEVYNQMNCYGPGCHSDQLLGQWWANILNLGYLFPKEYITTTLNSIYKYNWRKNFYGHIQTPRRFAEDDEPGLLMCSWPKGGRPESPILYCDEIWTGMEYQIAGLMIAEGMWDKALEIVEGVRSRYTGVRKNPFSEIECGGHYARAMSSYAMLILASGFYYDNRTLKIIPRTPSCDGKFFFSTGTGWGTFIFEKQKNEVTLTINVEFGELEITKILLPVDRVSIRKADLITDKFNLPPKSFTVGEVTTDSYNRPLISIELTSPLVVGLENPHLTVKLELK
ncbi:MAG: non-lysosomal glucosylceramidase [Candidatus Hydrogenedentes bacterium]|nr:non-lysosomal glucosylceramidase [Candidatus Hydrogenedentota bacterium]